MQISEAGEVIRVIRHKRDCPPQPFFGNVPIVISQPKIRNVPIVKDVDDGGSLTIRQKVAACEIELKYQEYADQPKTSQDKNGTAWLILMRHQD